MAIHLQSIPLFPLDVVLFPGMVLPLHIFEPRYQKMVRDCMVRGEGFGLIWAEGEGFDLPNERPLIGTKAMLTEVMPFPDGRFNISAVGSERFTVHSVVQQEPYPMGNIEPYPSLGGDSSAAKRYVPTLGKLFREYLQLLGRVIEQEIVLEPLPEDPTILSFVVAILYHGQNWRKQELLAIRSIPELLSREIDLLRMEIPLLREMLQMRDCHRLPPLIASSLAMYSLS